MLQQNERSAVSATVHDGPSSGSTKWLRLGNGDTILLDFDDGATFAFGTKWYRSFPRAATNARFAAVGVLINPDGSVDHSPYVQPAVVL